MRIFISIFSIVLLTAAVAADTPPKDIGVAGFEKLAAEGDAQAMTELAFLR